MTFMSVLDIICFVSFNYVFFFKKQGRKRPLDMPKRRERERKVEGEI